MKKALIASVAGAVALTAAIAPAPASAASSIWSIINNNSGPVGGGGDNTTDVLADLILIAGMSGMLSDCKSNNSPKYTMFAPIDLVFNGYDDTNGNSTDNEIDGLFDILGTSVSGLSKSPSVVAGILNDHIVNGVFSPDMLDSADDDSYKGDQGIKKITARSGYVLSIVNDDVEVPAGAFIPDWLDAIYVDGNLVYIGDKLEEDGLGGVEACNGWVYFFDGFIDSSSNALHEGLNVKDSPNDGTPGGTETQSLPDTL